MVTNRRPVGSAYGDQEREDGGYDFLYGDLEGPRGSERFTGAGRRGFRAALLRGPRELRSRYAIETPRAGVYIFGEQRSWQASIDELVDLDERLAARLGAEPLLVGVSWISSSGLSTTPADGAEPSGSVAAFTRFLGDTDGFLAQTERQCFSGSFCIAHSRGARLLSQGLCHLGDLPEARVGRCLFDETVLLEPDLSLRDLALDGEGVWISRLSRRVHVYRSRAERASAGPPARLGAGGRPAVPSAGETRRLPANLVVVEAGRCAEISGHRREDLRGRWRKTESARDAFWNDSEVLADIAHVLAQTDEDEIPTRRQDPGATDHSGQHFRLV